MKKAVSIFILFGVCAGAAERPRLAGRLREPQFRLKEAQRLSARHSREQAAAIRDAKRQAWSPLQALGRPTSRELMAIRDGKVLIYQTENWNAAISTGAHLVRHWYPHFVTGDNVMVGVWDFRLIRATHVEFDGRVSTKDSGSPHFHATHVFGTIAASGIDPGAEGMAPQALGESYDWNSDLAEMTTRAMAAPSETNGIQLSNHSYGHISGWDFDSSPPRWYGTWGQGYRESDFFGIYSHEAADWDSLCYNAPYFLPVKSAGNDRSDGAGVPGWDFSYYDLGWQIKPYDPQTDPLGDNADGGYDTIPDIGNAKNILTVGAVNDAVSNSVRSPVRATMTAYSGWGPADDGRIKPDIVANGTALYSTDSGGDSAYTTLSGTSMSAPNACGSAALLVEYHRRLFADRPILSATLKGLIIHTADDLGNVGPDYAYGWGLMNVFAAAEHMRTHEEFPEAQRMREDSLSATNASHSFALLWDRVSPIKVTLCWTDPPGPHQSVLDSRTPVLVNDLDLRVIDPQGTTNFPYTLSVTNPSAPAIVGDNVIDNVEQISIDAPGGGDVFTIVVSHKNALQNGLQHYSLCVDGGSAPPHVQHEPLQNTSVTNEPYAIDAVISALQPLNTNALWLFWTTNAAEVGFTSNRLASVSNDLFRATIPPQPLETKISYYLYAEISNGLAAASPPGAPADKHVFYVAPEADLMVLGSPSSIGTVVPDYGSHSFPSGIAVNATALSSDTPDQGGHRYACKGWVGSGNVPIDGTSNNVSFVIGQSSALVWRWESQYRLAQTSSVPGIISTATWWEASSEGWTVEAEPAVTVANTEYRFVEWLIDDLRQPSPTGVTVNPANGFLMTTAHVAAAAYLPADEDDDGDGMADWWERFYFGSLTPSSSADSDGDGYLNVEEYEDRSNPRSVASVPSGPTIEHVPLGDALPSPAPWPVSAIVADNFAVRDVILRWQRNGLNWRQTPMISSGTPNSYTSAIPAPGTLGDTFQYVIEATDEAGYFVQDEIHNSYVAYPLLEVAPTVVDVLLLPGNATNTLFTVGNFGNTNLDWSMTVGEVGHEDDIESGPNGWQHSGANDLWHITSFRSWSAAHSWYCGDESDRLYDDSMNASLVTPPLLLARGAQLAFMQWCKTEPQAGNYMWDGAVVEISTNAGSTYHMVTPVGGYPYLIVNNPASPFAPDTPCLGGTGGWERVAVDLSAYSGSEALIRFRFGSDGYVVDEGWYIDDIVITPHSAAATNGWLAFSATNGSIRESAATNVLVAIDTTQLPSTADGLVILQVNGNDPLEPTASVEVALHVRSPPLLDLSFAEQTSRDGSGLVTVSNTVYNVDREPCGLELRFSTNSGQTWASAWTVAAQAELGGVSVDSTGAVQVAGIATSNGIAAATNHVTVVWGSTNGAGIALATNTIVRSRVWDGFFWSDPVTSQPFIVDNEAPSAPAVLFVYDHWTNLWQTNRTFLCSWSISSDGNGIGLAGYAHAVTNGPVAHLQTTNFTQAPIALDTASSDGSNLWVAVSSVDLFGNASVPRQVGPYYVDTTPPSAAGASVQFATSSFGDYVIGTEFPFAWNGFTDSGAGLAGYYFSFADGAPTTNGQWTVQPSVVLTEGLPDQTNAVYVWARDNVGLIGSAANAQVLLLSHAGDYDDDGRPNSTEEIAGTDAADADSHFGPAAEATLIGTNVTEFVLYWNSISNRVYGVHCATDLLSNIWLPVPGHSNMPGTGNLMSYTNIVTGPQKRYYRLTVAIP